MCTIGYCKDLKVIFKNRDKFLSIQEEMVVDENIIACRTVGDTYYSWGMNKYGCGFVSAAINSALWPQLVYSGRNEEANKQYAMENKGLENPIEIISTLLSEVRSVNMWLEAITNSKINFKGYNLIIADSQTSYHIEIYQEQRVVRKILNNEVITNHFRTIQYGPRTRREYDSTFRRFDYGNQKIQTVSCLENVFEVLKPSNPKDQKMIWRNNGFKTISSSIINFSEGYSYYAKSLEENYGRVSFNGKSKRNYSYDELAQFEMSRYIDLNLYHEVERTHPFYKEMIDEICIVIKNTCDRKKKYKVLEMGAGTGLFTESLLKFPFLEVTAVELDVECCEIMKKHLGNAKQCEIIHGDAVDFCREGYYDLVFTTFAHDHIHYEKGLNFAKNIKNNLKQGGIYIMGGEILPFYSNMQERENSLYKYHGYIVEKALRDKNFRVAQIEINALESGINMIGDFKRHEKLFEEELSSSGLEQILKKKIGPAEPKDAGGVFVYVFKNAK